MGGLRELEAGPRVPVTARLTDPDTDHHKERSMNRTLVAMALASLLLLPKPGAAGEPHAGHGVAPAAKPAPAPAIVKTYVGESKPIGHGTVRTWVGVDKS